VNVTTSSDLITKRENRYTLKDNLNFLLGKFAVRIGFAEHSQDSNFYSTISQPAIR